MTFCSKEQDERKIITKVEHVNNSYTLHYLDGSESTFINISINIIIFISLLCLFNHYVF